MTKVLEGLRIFPDRMRANIDSTHGVFFSQRVLLALVERGLPREQAYDIVQRAAAESWASGAHFREAVWRSVEGFGAISKEDFWGLFQLGPFVRYMQIFQGNRAGFDNRNANTIIFGLSLETGMRTGRPAFEPVEQAPLAMAVAVPAARLDRDGDGVPDDVDNCPDIRGPASNAGCPVYEKIIVKRDKLELKEKIQFAWNDSVIEAVSYPALAEVAKALQDNPAFRVAIEGHASSEGADDHNQSLSSRRAEAVLEYVASHGVARDRLLSKGFSSSRPIESNSSESGRVANRRVEFVVHFIILKEGGLQ